MATSVPMKGSIGTFSVDKCLDFLEEGGDREWKILIKSNQGAAIEFLLKGLVRQGLRKEPLLRSLAKIA